ncbi:MULTISPECIES: amino acid adenylation domain-containing protein [Micromonospora]|nr:MULTISPECIES: amino acid adenylation domain-containing protein [Micromonospora]NES13766.1 amino acid adenylation domain-containing protein [Micromonospora sp. PPF5-17B]NES35557.1 amino acid adenylation domain-containing protein [Micromonospora solifontis]NES55957.1 amino acid adenylation domain-containing protein [Micromonospora sp. PPF5-6]
MTTLDSVPSQPPDEADIEPFALLSPRDRRIVPAGALDGYPLPEVQADLVEEDGAFTRVDLDGRRVTDPAPFSPERFAEAVRAVVRTHELLRTSVDPSGGTEPCHLVHPDAAIPLAVHDHRSVDEAKREAMSAALLDAERVTPFDPAAPGPLRLTVILETEQTWTLLVAAPRALTSVADPAGILAELLRAYRAGGSAAVATGTRHAPCVAAALDAAADFDGADHWTGLLTGTSCALPGGWGGAPGSTELTVDLTDLSAGLRALAAAAGASPATVLLAAHQTVLRVLGAEPGGYTEATLTPDGRPDLAGTGCERLLHRVTLPLPLVTGAATWRGLVARVAEAERVAWTHRHAYRPPAGPVDRSQHAHFAWDTAADLPVAAVPGLPTDEAAYGLRVTAGPDRLRLRAAGATVNASHARRLAAHYREVLAAMAADPDGDAEGTHLPAGERRAVLVDWAVAGTVDRGEVTAVDLIRAQARSTPDRVAVRVGDVRLTYRDLIRRADRLTHHLLDHGAGPGTLVGVCLGRTPDLVPALLAAWQTGAGYLPLDPELPPERLRHMLDAADTPVVVTSTAQQPTLTGLYDGTLVLVDTDAAAIAARPDTPVDVSVRPSDLAYVIFTSGSTGRPKGVMVEHAGLVNYLLWTVDAYAAHGPGGAPVFSSISFDLGIPNIFTPLITGEPVHLLPEPLDTADLGAHLLTGAPYSFIKMTPGHLDLLTWQLTAEQARGLAGIVIAAGDSFTRALAARWLELAGRHGTKVATEYGPTEITIGNSGQRISEPPATELVPLGAPIVNTTMYVLTERLDPVPVGVPGEVYIGGLGVARGYLGRPDLTAERFLRDPYGPPGSRLYRSGDLARWLPDGTLEFLGRIDNQVKIRGYRVELGEIQARLTAHPHVRDAVVIAREPSPGEKRLVAYLVLAAGQPLDPAALRAHLTADLPDYMIPAAFVAIDHIPLTTNGKVDARALPTR